VGGWISRRRDWGGGGGSSTVKQCANGACRGVSRGTQVDTGVVSSGRRVVSVDPVRPGAISRAWSAGRRDAEWQGGRCGAIVRGLRRRGYDRSMRSYLTTRPGWAITRPRKPGLTRRRCAVGGVDDEDGGALRRGEARGWLYRLRWLMRGRSGELGARHARVENRASRTVKGGERRGQLKVWSFSSVLSLSLARQSRPNRIRGASFLDLHAGRRNRLGFADGRLAGPRGTAPKGGGAAAGGFRRLQPM